MKSIILAFSFALATTANAVEFAFGEYDIVLHRENGTEWSSPLNLELGAFSAGFTPNSTNTSLWEANFRNNQIEALDSITGYYSPDTGIWSDRIIVNTSDANFSTGTQLYVWAYDSKAIDGKSEWLLLTDTNWRLGNIDPTLPTQDFILGDSTERILGGFAYSDSFASTMVITAVPEPSTYAAIFGVLTLGGVCYRRYRRK